MSPYQIAMIQWSWKQVAPIADTAASLFYDRLFELDPSLKPLFKGDMAEQRRKLMQMLGTAVNALNRLEQVVPVLRALGARHATYGVKSEYYATVGEALLWTLKRGLGDAFTDEVRDAWFAAYAVLSATMQQGALEAMQPSQTTRAIAA